MKYDDAFRKELREGDNNALTYILNDGDKIDCNYGLDTVLLTDEMIASLQEGKALWVNVNNSEFAVVLSKGKLGN